MHILCHEKPSFMEVGWMAGNDILETGVYYGALFLTHQESRKFSITVKDEATVDVQCVIWYYLIADYCLYGSSRGKIRYHIMRGLLRCSFNCDGQCESLRTWDE